MIFPAARIGDIIQSRLTGKAYIITGYYGDRLTAVDTVDITHESEWLILGRMPGSAHYRLAPKGNDLSESGEISK